MALRRRIQIPLLPPLLQLLLAIHLQHPIIPSYRDHMWSLKDVRCKVLAGLLAEIAGALKEAFSTFDYPKKPFFPVIAKQGLMTGTYTKTKCWFWESVLVTSARASSRNFCRRKALELATERLNSTVEVFYGSFVWALKLWVAHERLEVG